MQREIKKLGFKEHIRHHPWVSHSLVNIVFSETTSGVVEDPYSVSLHINLNNESGLVEDCRTSATHCAKPSDVFKLLRAMCDSIISEMEKTE